MATSVVLLADTHLPKRAKVLPPEVWAAVDAADVVFHAGDWVDLATVEALEERARRLVAVWGNNDGPELRERMPETARLELEGLRIAMTHETGSAAGRETRMDARFPDADLLVFGHSHIPWQSTTPRGLLLLNPGSPTDRRRQPHRTFMTLTLDRGAVHDVTVVPIPIDP